MSKDKKDVMKEKLGCGCCTDDSIFLKAISNARADRIKVLERDIQALKEQSQIDLRVKKDLDKKLDDLTADRNALYVQHLRLKSDYATLLHKNDILNNAKTNLIKSNQGLQSKVAKQANEIKRLNDIIKSARDWLNVAQENARKHQKLKADYAALSVALDQASKDTENNFEYGKVKGMEELWTSIQWAQDRLKRGDKLFPIYGYYCMAACVDNLTATAFLRKTLEWQEKEARDIKIGDEVVVISSMGSVVVISSMGSDDSDYGIVYNIIERAGHKSYHIIGSKNCIAFGDSAITDGSVRKTGKHYDHIPFDYIA